MSKGGYFLRVRIALYAQGAARHRLENLELAIQSDVRAVLSLSFGRREDSACSRLKTHSRFLPVVEMTIFDVVMNRNCAIQF